VVEELLFVVLEEDEFCVGALLELSVSFPPQAVAIPENAIVKQSTKESFFQAFMFLFLLIGILPYLDIFLEFD
jgi:hypothetical protein